MGVYLRRSDKSGGGVTVLVTAVDHAPCGNVDVISEAIFIKRVDEKVGKKKAEDGEGDEA